MTRIKFCGMRRLVDVAAANELQPDYIGFIFAPKSRRYVNEMLALQMKQQLRPEIQAVGVFVNESLDVIEKYLKDGIIDIAQLHGQETPETIKELQQRTGKPVWKAFRVETEADILRAQESPADAILLDSGDGGTGTVFNWDLLQHITRPYILAGGLSPENAAEALERLHPYGMDVSSGIETEGLKDKRKMTAFMAAIRKDETV